MKTSWQVERRYIINREQKRKRKKGTVSRYRTPCLSLCVFLAT